MSTDLQILYFRFSYLFFAQVANACCLDQLCIVLDQGNGPFFGVVSDAYFECIRQEKIVPVLELVPASQFNFS